MDAKDVVHEEDVVDAMDNGVRWRIGMTRGSLAITKTSTSWSGSMWMRRRISVEPEKGAAPARGRCAGAWIGVWVVREDSYVSARCCGRVGCVS